MPKKPNNIFFDLLDRFIEKTRIDINEYFSKYHNQIIINHFIRKNRWIELISRLNTESTNHLFEMMYKYNRKKSLGT